MKKNVKFAGNNIDVVTKFDKIHIYLNGKEVQNVDAVELGVNLCVSFLGGIWIGITNQKK